jgi:cyclophilin family peptidyl-prolyl cis-trans isomerase
VLAKLHADYPEDVRIVFRHFPLIGTPEQPFHDKAALSGQAAEAAGLQGKFWEMHDLLFERQSEWISLPAADFQTWVIAQAAGVGLDTAQFETDLTSQPIVDKVQAAWDFGVEIGLPGTPFVLLNGRIWDTNIPLSYANLSAVTLLTLLEQRQYTACPPVTIDASKIYLATIKTEKGDIQLELFPEQAPITVNSFVFLARSDWYDNTTFHRVISGQIAQGGDPSGTGYGGPGYAFVNEVTSSLTFDQEGVLAMANAGADSNGSQFFITLGPAPQYNGSYTIFGRVIAGMDVVRQLTPRDPSAAANLPPGDLILDVLIEEK